MKTKQMFVLVAVLTALLSHDARAFCDASAGRWLSRDPVHETGGRNLYAALQHQLVSRLDRWDQVQAYAPDSEHWPGQE